MSNIYKNVTELIGRTPLVEVEKIEKRFKLQARLLVKLDGYNPAGSAKDRIAYQMILCLPYLIQILLPSYIVLLSFKDLCLY